MRWTIKWPVADDEEAAERQEMLDRKIAKGGPTKDIIAKAEKLGGVVMGEFEMPAKSGRGEGR